MTNEEIMKAASRISICLLISLLFRFDTGWGDCRNPEGGCLSPKSKLEEKDGFQSFLDQGRDFLNANLKIPDDRKFGFPDHPVIDAANYALDLKNQRRKLSLLILAVADHYGISWSSVLPLLTSAEMLHSATLVLDDLPQLDNDPVRRNKAATHIMFGETTAHHAAGAMLMRSVSNLNKLGFETSRIGRLQDLFVESFEDTALGQMQEKAMNEVKEQKPISLEDLERISFLKTSSLFELLLCGSAILANASEAELAVWKSIAYHTGIIYQIKNDILDQYGKRKDIGKVPGGDQKKKMETYTSLVGEEGVRKRMRYHLLYLNEELSKLGKGKGYISELLGDILRIHLETFQFDPGNEDLFDPRRLKNYLNPELPTVLLLDVHNVLLESGGERAYIQLYKELTGESPSEEWLDENVRKKW